MPTLPPAMLPLCTPFAPLFQRRVWPAVLVLVLGTLLAPGKRTVTAALRERLRDRVLPEGYGPAQVHPDGKRTGELLAHGNNRGD